MDLQYITNTEPPPAQSVLQYSISPDMVFVSTATQPMYANLTITVFNPSTEAVTCQMFEFGFYVGAEVDDLTTTATGIQSSSAQTGWTISEQATENTDTLTLYQFSVPASGMANQQLAANQSLVFQLDGIQINEAVGEGGASIVITEVTGADQDNLSLVQGEITISKQTPTLSIQNFSVDPPTPVNPGAAIDVKWSLVESDHWQLYDTNSATLLYDSETDPPQSSYTAYPEQTTTYELLAWADQLFTAQQATAMVSAPTLTAEPPNATVNALTDVTINWTSNYAQTVTISPPPASGPATVSATSGQGSFVVQPAENITYTLHATGQNNSESQPQYVVVNINPPSITSFTASPTSCEQGQSANLSWETQSATSAQLSQTIFGNPNINNLGVVGLSSTGYTVKPTGISTYTLAAQNASSEPAQATATVCAIAAVVTLKASPVALTSDGSNVWAVDVGGGLTQIPIIAPNETNIYAIYNNSNGAVSYASGIIFTVPEMNTLTFWNLIKILGNKYPMIVPVAFGASSSQYPLGLSAQGPWLWIPLTNNGLGMFRQDGDSSWSDLWGSGIGDGPCVVISDGTNLWTANTTKNTVWQMNTDNPSTLLSTIDVPSPSALLFDGTYVWVASADTGGSSSYNITKLLAENASIQGQYNVATGPFALGFDGTNIWAASANNTITIMETNGTVLATFQIAGDPSSFLFDGANMWVALKGSNQVAQIML